MADKTLNPVEALDKAWEEGQITDQAEPETEVEEKVETQTQSNDETKTEDKTDHAFKEMRAELKALKAALAEAQKAKEEQPDKTQTESPKQSDNEVERLKQELSKMKEEMAEKERTAKVDALNGEINRLTSELEISDDEMRSIIDQIGADGYTLEALLAMPQKAIGKLIKGYAADTIVEKKTQKALSKKKAFVEEKVSGELSGDDDPYSADALKKDIEAYARKTKPWLFKK